MEKRFPIDRELGLAMVAFVEHTQDWFETRDTVMLDVHVEEYRQAVIDAADRGFENALAWHTLGMWTDIGKQRIGCFARAIEVSKKEMATNRQPGPMRHWDSTFRQADSYYEIARVHAIEGLADVALKFLDRALASSREADYWAGRGKLRVFTVTKKILKLDKQIRRSRAQSSPDRT
jgi:hypothetical protein